MHRQITQGELVKILERLVFKICIVGKNFISLGIEDGRGRHGWKVELIYKHKMKAIPIELLAKHSMPKVLFTVESI